MGESWSRIVPLRERFGPITDRFVACSQDSTRQYSVFLQRCPVLCDQQRAYLTGSLQQTSPVIPSTVKRCFISIRTAPLYSTTTSTYLNSSIFMSQVNTRFIISTTRWNYTWCITTSGMRRQWLLSSSRRANTIHFLRPSWNMLLLE